MMDKQAVQWIRRWPFGLGFYGEQQTESIHARMDSLLRTCSSIRKPPDRRKRAVLEHYWSVCIVQVDQIMSQLKKRKLKQEESLD